MTGNQKNIFIALNKCHNKVYKLYTKHAKRQSKNSKGLKKQKSLHEDPNQSTKSHIV